MVEGDGKCRDPRRPCQTQLGRDPRYLVHGTILAISLSFGWYRDTSNPISLRIDILTVGNTSKENGWLRWEEPQFMYKR